MRCLERNKQTFYYCLLDPTKEVRMLDEYGNETGETIPYYDAHVSARANISPATGQSSVEQFGNLEGYDKVIVTDDLTCPITESTVLFVDKAPEYTNIETYIIETPDPDPDPEPDDGDQDPDEPSDGGEGNEPQDGGTDGTGTDDGEDAEPGAADDGEGDDGESGDEPEPQFVPATYSRPAYDYIVKRVAKSLNSVSIAIRKVKVS